MPSVSRDEPKVGDRVSFVEVSETWNSRRYYKTCDGVLVSTGVVTLVWADERCKPEMIRVANDKIFTSEMDAIAAAKKLNAPYLLALKALHAKMRTALEPARKKRRSFWRGVL